MNKKTGIGSIRKPSGKPVSFDFGHSGIFLEAATRVMVSLHSIGEQIDLEAANASARMDFLEAYVIDLIGLIALEKTTDIIKSIAEDQARDMGWGVSPFLGPGSVHGWDIEEQSKLCKLLPMDKINATMRHNSVLYPLKTISGLIGIGPAYESNKVGNTCDICSKKDNCPMNRQN